MTSKRIFIGAGAFALVVVIAIGLVELSNQSSTQSTPLKLTPAQMQARLAGSPARLTGLHSEANELLGGGARALRAQIAALRGYPVVIDKWASWCESCRAEIGAFQRASVALGRRVAFIGIDSGEATRSDALGVLRSLPLSYPSYYDPSGHLGEAITGSSNVPVTVFYDRHGAVQYIRQGAYPDAAKLERDIEHYALDA